MELRRSDYENYDYRQFWKDDQRLYEDRCERMALRKLLSPIGGQRGIFADIGCGYGRLFAEYKGFGTILMLDYSMKNLRTAKSNIEKYLGPDKQRLSSVYFIAADALKLPLATDSVDVLLTVRVVHHLSNPQFYFDQVRRVTKGGGTFIMEFANKRNTKNILRSLVGKMDTSPFNLLPSRVGDTILNYHPKHLLAMLAERNFGICKLLSVSNFRIQLVKKALPLKFLLSLENMYQNVFSFLSLGPSIFIKAELPKQVSDSMKASKIEDILACPNCAGAKLNLAPQEAACTKCGKRYRVEEGIFNFKS